MLNIQDRNSDDTKCGKKMGVQELSNFDVLPLFYAEVYFLSS